MIDRVWGLYFGGTNVKQELPEKPSKITQIKKMGKGFVWFP